MSMRTALLLLVLLLAAAPAGASEKLLGVHIGFDSRALYYAAGGDEARAMKAHIDKAADLGAKVVRLPADWRQLQPQPGPPEASFDRARLNAMIETIGHADRLGIKIVLMLAQSPCWAVPAGLDCDAQEAIWHRPIDPKTYALAFARLAKAVRRAGLSKAVIGYEVWNEPNSITFWPTGAIRTGYNVLIGASAAFDYTELLNATYDALKAVDPAITVVGGSLAAADVDYLAAMYLAGARYDALAIHPYAKANPDNDGIAYRPDECGGSADPLAPPWCYKGGVDALRRLMLAHDDRRPVWFTEFGWSSGYGWGGSRGEEAQADNLARALDILKGWDFVPVAIVYRLIDTEEGMGLMRPDFVAKKAGEVFRRAARGVDAVPTLREIRGNVD